MGRSKFLVNKRRQRPLNYKPQPLFILSKGRLVCGLLDLLLIVADVRLEKKQF